MQGRHDGRLLPIGRVRVPPESDRAVEVLEHSLSLLSEVGDARGHAFATLEQLRDPVGLTFSLWQLTLWELEFGDVDEAAGQATRMVEFAGRMPVPLFAAHAAESVGLVARAQRHLAEARQRFGTAIQLHGEIGNATCLAHCLEHIALGALDMADAIRAATLLGAAEALREDIAAPAVLPFEGMWHDAAMAAARQTLGAQAFTAAWRRGRDLDLNGAITLGLQSTGRKTAEAEAT